MTPEQIAKVNTEDAHQQALICWRGEVLQQYPELRWLFAIPNGGKRNKREAGKLKSTGVMAGVLDLCLPVARKGYHGMYIEMKQEKRRTHKHGGLDIKQIQFGNFVHLQGYFVVVCYTWREAANKLEEYLS